MRFAFKTWSDTSILTWRSCLELILDLGRKISMSFAPVRNMYQADRIMWLRAACDIGSCFSHRDRRLKPFMNVADVHKIVVVGFVSGGRRAVPSWLTKERRENGVYSHAFGSVLGTLGGISPSHSGLSRPVNESWGSLCELDAFRVNLPNFHLNERL
jgi:hypothetical protein